MDRQELMAYLDQCLQPERFNDYCPNGLQVEGKKAINKIITGVTACQALLDRAVKEQADLILVHHGYFWKNEQPNIIGMKKKRLKTLLMADINLVAYHLPLDAQVQFGNNVQLAKHLGIEIDGEILNYQGMGLLLTGHLPQPATGSEFAALIAKKLDRTPLHIGQDDTKINTVAWCTGAAPDLIELVVQAGVDAYLTGEAAERTVHIARETGVHFYAAGHHATERYGIKALGEHLAERFGLTVKFIDIDNPI
ncbi:MAG: Nif3-like dinuclear metal center hexameric protein [Gammaproteobacteria bacterium RIFCSPHIGHO2_12_FULL_35_23]|nr:MAG: Nif3-like dinuclear metal center hexameric protein [Gammaproteobacteria bacterium RIFCSPHIGHO2_12_FULL_35_23]